MIADMKAKVSSRRLIAIAVGWLVGLALVGGQAAESAKAGEAEVIRDAWGVPHVFAKREVDGFFGLGYVCAEDRRLQMELFRRRAHGRLAEVFGEKFVDTDRRFRVAGLGRY